jgi:putative FmdB family regulatory protein
VPLYEYECPSCGTFEVIQKFSDATLTQCPKCQSAVEKLLSASAFHLKGSGWYITDYARKGKSESKSKPESTTESKAESKSESKTDSSASTSSTTAAAPATP